MTKEIAVLDHGYIKYVQHCGTDETVIETARMSTGKGFQGWDKDADLLEYLYENDHATPFESGDLMIEVQCPIFVVRQWHRHRTQSYNELSGRYTEMPDLFYVPKTDRIQKQSTSNKQGSAGEFTEGEQSKIQIMLEEDQENSRWNYEDYLDMGLSRELARINLPLSQYTRFRAKANLRNWFAFLNLRLDEHAQEEIRKFAQAVAIIIQELWPRSYELFLEHTFFAVKFSRTEMDFLREFYLPKQFDLIDIGNFEANANASLTPKRMQILAKKLGLVLNESS
jgi:thymidylate synthase (FAD)